MVQVYGWLYRHADRLMDHVFWVIGEDVELEALADGIREQLKPYSLM